MALLDSLLSSVLGGGDKAQLIAGLASQLLTGQSAAPGAPNGLDGLIQQFQRAGLGDLINSWVGTGANQAATGAQIGQALGPQTVSHFAQETGMQNNEVTDLLAKLLPQMVDRVTPTGDVPQQNDLQGMLSGLLGSLSK